MNKTDTGFIGLVALLVGVAIISGLMFMQYKKSGLEKVNTEGQTENNSELDAGFNFNAGGDYGTPIDRAQDAKNLLESRY